MMGAQRSAAGTAKQLRALLLLAVTCDVVLICLRVVLYMPFLWQHDALVYLLEPVVLLIIYAGIALITTTHTTPQRHAAVRIGAAVGVVSGGMWIGNLALETFSAAGMPVTAPFLLGAFILWGVAGFLATRQTGSLAHGLVAASWGAMTCVLLAISFGFSLTYTSLPTLERLLVADPDFLRSHWTDLQAFAIANSYDSAFSHLLGALLVATVVGTVGSLAGMRVSRARQRRVASGGRSPGEVSL